VTGTVPTFGACAGCGAGAVVAPQARMRAAGIGDDDKPPIGDPEDDEGYDDDEDDERDEEDDDEDTLWTLVGPPGVICWDSGTAMHKFVLYWLA
jgi:hypothetical protein